MNISTEQHTVIAPGTYEALASAYFMVIIFENKQRSQPIKMKEGVRGINVPTKVEVTTDGWVKEIPPQKETIERFSKMISPDNSGWLEKVKWRQDNQYWLDKSFAIAVRILTRLRELDMTKDELALEMCMTNEELKPILQGYENLTLKTIGDLEYILKCDLISTKVKKENNK